ncbi:MAG: TldD/PmbA family protein [Planctomycetota bacterium]
MESHDPRGVLADALARAGVDGHVELRYHQKRSRSVAVEKGRVDQARAAEHTGVGVRVLAGGTFGFASTDRLEADAVVRAIETAAAAARASASARTERLEAPPATEHLAVGEYETDGYAELRASDLESRVALALAMEERTRGQSTKITSAATSYSEVFEEKGIVTSDGARAWTRVARPELRVSAVASADGELQRGARTVGVTGAWDCLFQAATSEELGDAAARMAVDLLSAGYAEGGKRKVVLSPSIVGLLTHEAIGHTVEADFVEAGSCARDRVGTRVASELVTLRDSGASEHVRGAGGIVPVDDEGVLTRPATIIEDGVLRSYLHDRHTAARFGVEPAGNARAWEYDDEPLIRMRNTYIEPGTSTLDEIVAGIDDGLLLDGPRNGQADANGEFMFGTLQAWPIKNGRRGPLQRGVNISGLAFDVLSTVDAVSSDFRWDLGAGYCGKGQPAKVDAGGPWLSCEVLVGGRG